MEKISPLLQILLSEKGYLNPQKERSFLSDEMANLRVEPEKVSFFLEYKDSLEPLKALGLEVLNSAGDVVVGRIAIDKVLELSTHPNVIFIERQLPPTLCLDHSLPDIKGNLVRTRNGDNWSGMTGEDVLIGIIDTGIDFTHKTFRNADGTTRIIGIWDQTLKAKTGDTVPGALPIVPALDQLAGQPPNPVQLGYGVEYSRDKITAALGVDNPHTIVRHKDEDKHGHGTHVAGIAGGDGSQSDSCFGAYTYVGVAPKAEFIIVRMAGLTPSDDPPPATSQGVAVDAIRYIIAVKEAVSASVHRPIPVVINGSFGSNNGRRDVKSGQARMIDNILNAFPTSVSLVFSAGNEGDANSHCTAMVVSGGQIDLIFNVPDNNKLVVIDIHYIGTNLRAAVKPPTAGAAFSGWFTNSTPDPLTNGINGTGNVTIANYSDNIWLSLTPPAPPPASNANLNNVSGLWVLRLQDTAAIATPIQAWSNTGIRFEASTGVTLTNVSSINVGATAENPIFVGAHATENARGIANGALADFSSRGPIATSPLGDTRNIRPHLTAPGVAITSALADFKDGCCCDCCYDFYRPLDGTSQAAPHVTGAVALMLQKNRTLGFQQIRQILQNTARTVDGQTLPNNDWGWGKLDVQAALNAVPALAPAGPAPLADPSGPVAFSTLPPQTPWLQLREEFSAIPRARFYQRLVADHFPEVRQLINTNKRVATVWHRNSGTALLRIGMQAAYQPDQPLPFEIEGITIVERLRHIAEILKKYGSEKLSGDIETYTKNWITLLDGGLSVRQLLHVFKQQETLAPETA